MTTMLVCGGRYFGHVHFLTPREALRAEMERAAKQNFMMREALDHLRQGRGVTKVISGGATGADAAAAHWARSRCLACIVVKAEWRRYGHAAGPIRNGKMLDLKPDFVVAFPGRTGTADMVCQATKAGVEVIDYRETFA